MQVFQRFWHALITTRWGWFFIGALVGASLASLLILRTLQPRLIRPIYGVLTKIEDNGGWICVDPDRPEPEANSNNGRSLCTRLVFSGDTRPQPVLPALGTRVEAGFAKLPYPTWNRRTHIFVYLLPESPN